MRCCLLDAGDGAFKVIERTAATRTGDVFRFAGADTSCLQNAESGGVCHLVAYLLAALLFALVEEENTVAESVDDERSHVGSRFDLQVFHLIFGVVLEENKRIFQSFIHQLVRQSAVFAQSVGVDALCDKDYFRMILQAGNRFVVQSHVTDEQEFQ